MDQSLDETRIPAVLTADQMIALDTFAIHGVSSYHVRGFDAAMRSPLFPADWAPGAAVVP